MAEQVLDCRGVEIQVGSTVVVAGLGGRLHERIVKRLERPGKPEWWVNVRFENGSYSTPECVAVVK